MSLNVDEIDYVGQYELGALRNRNRITIPKYHPTRVPVWRDNVLKAAIMYGATDLLRKKYDLVSHEQHAETQKAIKQEDAPTSRFEPSTKPCTPLKSVPSSAGLEQSDDAKVETPLLSNVIRRLEPDDISQYRPSSKCPDVADISIADKYLEEMFKKDLYFYHEGVAESDKDRSRRMVLYKAMYDSVKEYDYLVANVVTGDVREIFNRVHLKGQPNVFKQQRELVRELHMFVKTKDISFDAWRTEYDANLRNLRLFGIPFSDQYMKSMLMELMAHDTRYNHTLRRIEETPELTLADCYAMLTNRATIIGDLIPSVATKKKGKNIYALTTTEKVKNSRSDLRGSRGSSTNGREKGICFAYTKYGKCSRPSCPFDHKSTTRSSKDTRTQKGGARQSIDGGDQVCYQYQLNQTCSRGSSCRYKHEGRAQAPVNMVRLCAANPEKEEKGSKEQKLTEQTPEGVGMVHFEKGSNIILHSLVDDTRLNGRRGVVMSSTVESGRHQVLVGNKVVAVKAINMRLDSRVSKPKRGLKYESLCADPAKVKTKKKSHNKHVHFAFDHTNEVSDSGNAAGKQTTFAELNSITEEPNLDNDGENDFAYLDSGAAVHVLNSAKYLIPDSIVEEDTLLLTAEKDGMPLVSHVKGTALYRSSDSDCQGHVVLRDCVISDQIAQPVISLSKLTDDGYSVRFHGSKVVIDDGKQQVMALDRNKRASHIKNFANSENFSGHSSKCGISVYSDSTLNYGSESLAHPVTADTDDLYHVQLKDFVLGKEIAHGVNSVSTQCPDKYLELLHQRLGHASFERVRHICHQLSGHKPRSEHKACEACAVAKTVNQPYPVIARHRATKVLERVSADLCGPFATQTPHGERYYAIFIDEYTRYISVYLLKRKSDFQQAFETYLAMAENAHQPRRLSILRTDGGG